MSALTPITTIFGRFFRWWFGELANLGKKIWSPTNGRRQQLIVTPADDEIVFYHSSGPFRLGLMRPPTRRPSKLRQLGSVSLNTGTDTAQDDLVSRIIAPVKGQIREVILRLPRKDVLQASVELPTAASENLREVLGFEMDRHTPFKSEEVYFDYRANGVEKNAKRIIVNLALVPRAIADKEIARLQNWGIVPDRLEFEGANQEEGPDYNLLPPPADMPGSGVRQRFNIITAIAACVLLAVAIYLPLQAKQAQLRPVEAKLGSVRSEAAQASALRQKVEELVTREQFLVGQKEINLTAIRLLDDITRILPDDTWVIQFNWSGDRISLAGFSPTTSALIALLEKSDLLSEVRFNSPVTVDPRIGIERFNLSATVVRKEAL